MRNAPRGTIPEARARPFVNLRCEGSVIDFNNLGPDDPQRQAPQSDLLERWTRARHRMNLDRIARLSERDIRIMLATVAPCDSCGQPPNINASVRKIGRMVARRGDRG